MLEGFKADQNMDNKRLAHPGKMVGEFEKSKNIEFHLKIHVIYQESGFEKK